MTFLGATVFRGHRLAGGIRRMWYGASRFHRWRERLAWWLLVRAARRWSMRHMDQFDSARFETPHGTVYLSLTLQTPWPDSFDPVDAHGRALVRPAPAGGVDEATRP